jgi:hypothetical protein
MKLKFRIAFTLLILSPFVSNAQIEEFKGDQYIQNNGNYEMLNIPDLQYYPIEGDFITIKFNSSTSESQIQLFETQTKQSYFFKKS